MNLIPRHRRGPKKLAEIATRIAADKANLLRCALRCDRHRRYVLAMGHREAAALYTVQTREYKARYRAAMHVYNEVVYNGRVNLKLISRYMHG